MTSSVIKVYSARMCGFCRAAERLLKNKGVTYEVIKVDEDPALYEHMKQISGRHTVPQIFIGDHHVGGFDDLSAANQSGELDKLLATI